MSGDTIKVPLVIPPNWAPAWEEKQLGIRKLRTLDLGDMLAASGRKLLAADVAADPLLQGSELDFGRSSAWLFLCGGSPAGLKLPVRFLLRLSDESELQVTAWQPTRLTGAAALEPVQAVPSRAPLITVI